MALDTRYHQMLEKYRAIKAPPPPKNNPTKTIATNIIGIIVGAIIFAVLQFLLSFVFSLLLSIPLVAFLLSWPASPRLWATMGINVGSFAIAYLLCVYICKSNKRGVKIGPILFSLIAIALGIYALITAPLYYEEASTAWGFVFSIIGYIGALVHSIKTRYETAPQRMPTHNSSNAGQSTPSAPLNRSAFDTQNHTESTDYQQGPSPGGYSVDDIEKVTAEIEDLNKQIAMLREMHLNAKKDLDGVSLLDVEEALKAGSITANQAKDSIDSIEALQQIIKNTPRMIEQIEALRNEKRKIIERMFSTTTIE